MNDDNRDLVIKAKAGDREARNELIVKNIGLIKHVVKHFKCKTLEYDDLLHEGVFGILKAVDKFDLTKGIKFSTYAHWWIRAYIVRAVEQTDLPIKVPTYVMEDRLCGKDTKEDETIDNICNMKSLETGIESADGIIQNMYGLLASDENIEEEYLRKELRTILISTINRLPEREKHVILETFGFNGITKSYKNIGAEIGLSHERVRQIKVKALAKIKRNCGRALQAYA